MRTLLPGRGLVEQWAAPLVDQRRLEGRAHEVHPVVLHRRRQDLDAGRQAVLVGQAARHRDAGHAREVGGDGRQVVEVHRQRVVELLAELERRRRRGRREQHVGVGERLREVLADQRAHLLRLAVVGVVVAARQGVRAQDDAALHLVAEAGLAGRPHHLLGAGRLDALGVRPQPVAHRVEAGQVAGRLGREDQVVGRERVHEARARHLDQLGAGRDHQVDRLLEPGEHAGLVPLAAELLDHADAHAGEVALGAAPRRTDQVGQGGVDGGGVLGVVTADDLVQQRRVEHGAGDRSGLVEGVGQRDEPVPRHAAVRRLHPDRARHGARLPDGAAGVGADGERRLVRRHGRRRPAAGPAGIRPRSHGLRVGP